MRTARERRKRKTALFSGSRRIETLVRSCSDGSGLATIEIYISVAPLAARVSQCSWSRITLTRWRCSWSPSTDATRHTVACHPHSFPMQPQVGWASKPFEPLTTAIVRSRTLAHAVGRLHYCWHSPRGFSIQRTHSVLYTLPRRRGPLKSRATTRERLSELMWCKAHDC